jgi:putative tricarboxylic transport membrane protein
MNAFGYSAIVFVIGFFLGERFELTLSQSLNLIDGDPTILMYHPVALGFFALAISSVYWFSIRTAKKKKQTAEAEKEDT